MSTYVKYPRTFHLPWSLGATSDDKTLSDVSIFDGKEVVVTEKMDGENTTLYRDHTHARSIDSKHHWSREWVKDFWARFAHDIPDDIRICGENLYATHSIFYAELASLFLGFSVWEEDRCFSWDETLEWFELFEIVPVRTLYRGEFNIDAITEAVEHIVENPEYHEGYVVRDVNSFTIDNFSSSVAKYVRGGHVQTDGHWMYCSVSKNHMLEDIPYFQRCEWQSCN